MMIAKSWMNITATVAGRQHPSPLFFPRLQAAGKLRRVMPSRRDREVPYGMKGGEQNGRIEEVVQSLVEES